MEPVHGTGIKLCQKERNENMKQGFKRIVSMALIASMIATMAPSTAWAASVDNTDAAQVEAQTAADEEVAPAAESAAETEAVEVQTETEPAATEETHHAEQHAAKIEPHIEHRILQHQSFAASWSDTMIAI